jgi:hypothetical protein
MAYLGNSPARSFISFERQVFTIVNSQTVYTLDHSVTNENDIRLVVNNIVQEPGSGKAYTATGTTLTLSAALVNGTDEMYCVFLGRATATEAPGAGSVGTAQIADDAVTEAKLGTGAVTSAKLSYPLTTFSSTGIDDNATSTAITIDSSENVGIGETSPLGKLHVKKSDTSASASTSADALVVEDNSENGISILSGTGTFGNIFFGDSGSNTIGRLLYNHSDNSMRFVTSNSEQMRIDSSGNLLVGTETNNVVVADAEGISIQADASIQANTSGSVIPCRIGRLGTDGTLIEFRGQTFVEGTISVSGSTVSYNGFTGTHWSRFQDNSTPTILKGTVLESLDEMCDWYNLEFDVTTITQDEDGNDVETVRTKKIPHVLLDSQSNGDVITYNHEGTDYQATIVKEADVKHMMSKVSDTVDAKNVYGVFNSWDKDGEGYNDFYVASVGSFVVRIKSGQTIAKGDLLQSNGDGTAKVQTDDNVKSSSFAKVLSTTIIETYDDGSYIVPCSLMC